MFLPELTLDGELPTGVHPARMEEIVARFGGDTAERQAATANLLRLYSLVQATGKLERFLVFGSYVTDEPAPNDVDIFVVMSKHFDVEEYAGPVRAVFSHAQAERDFGASVFWACQSSQPAIIEQLIEGWQIKRDLTRRGIVEVIE